MDGIIPSFGRLAGIDFGTVRVGIAVCDPSQNWVTPLETYARRSQSLDANFFRQLVERENLRGFVIGLPIHCDGQESQKSREVRSFAKWLNSVTTVPCCFYDERFSTAEARRLMGDSGLTPQQRKKRLDQLAAHLILSHYLASNSSSDCNESIEDPPKEQ